ncbi:hypothetical protein BJX63DRAFT_436789 [Aspergillus granulosus]|uniref:Uncharacterized protein n=1 Tax=Aspergillus granulosus TaxID=176169 RepID=A0ABR4GX64_9EURO
MPMPKIFRLALVIICTFSTVPNALNLDNRLDPQGPLGVTLDYSLATSWPNRYSKTGRQHGDFLPADGT